MEKTICTVGSSVETIVEPTSNVMCLQQPAVQTARVAKGPGRRQAHDRAGAALFFECYENNLSSSATNREAYEQTERSYTARTGCRRFRTYGSFRSAYSQFCRRATGRYCGNRTGMGAEWNLSCKISSDVNATGCGC